MSKTMGQLAPARIVKVTDGMAPVAGSGVKCMFNPYEYTLSKTNDFKEQNSVSDDEFVAFLRKEGATIYRVS